MGQEQSKFFPKEQEIQSKYPQDVAVVFGNFISRLTIESPNYTSGWLLAQVIRFSNSSSIIALKTQQKNPFLDCCLLQLERPLPLFDPSTILQPVHEKKVSKHLRLKDFRLIKCLGVGGYSRVILGRKKNTGLLYAIKTINKEFLIRKNKVRQAMDQRNILAQCNNPFVVTMHWAFQSREYLHQVLQFCPGGEFFYLMSKYGTFPEKVAKFYFAQIVLALEYLHFNNILYRDLKPQNILVDADGHIKLADFGLSKFIQHKGEMNYTFCGSPQYLSPQMIQQAGHNLSIDYYSLGVLLYEMLVGFPPFYEKNRDRMYENIIHSQAKFPSSVSKSARSLIRKLLEKDPVKRLKKCSIDKIKNHKWCRDIVWTSIHNKSIKPPVYFSPYQSYFDPKYELMDISDLKKSRSDDGRNPLFEGFQYMVRIKRQKKQNREIIRTHRWTEVESRTTASNQNLIRRTASSLRKRQEKKQKTKEKKQRHSSRHKRIKTEHHYSKSSRNFDFMN